MTDRQMIAQPPDFVRRYVNLADPRVGAQGSLDRGRGG